MEHCETGDANVFNIVTPNKPIVDKKEYRCLTLPNEMRVTLISDPSTDKSAVAMDVHIGSLSDPREVMGLAHFCEHMVFMGSQKYTEENVYSKYLSQNNGDYNAYTSSEHTNFFFQIKPENVFEAIDIFAQFFISPLFTESATNRELQAVNSEHEKNICNDFRRNLQLDRHLSDKNHDYNKFSTGSLKTLKEDPELNNINVRQALLDFHERYYSSNIMSLCILSKESLDVLQNLVVDLFSQVVNKHVELPFWDTHPWTAEHVKQIVYVVPIQDRFQLDIIWPIPDYTKLYQAKPEHYVCHLIGHEGEGSILALLKKKGWGYKLTVGPNKFGAGFSSLYLSIELFEEGISHIHEIITIIYQYCVILKSKEPEKWIFDEDSKIKEMRFRFREFSNLEVLVSQISRDMRSYSEEHTLEGPYVMTDFRPDLIKNIINCISPLQMKVYCISKKFEDKCIEEEYWYKTKYFVENFSEKDIEMWQNVELNSELFLPEPNPYVPSDFTIKTPIEDNISGPELLRDNPLSRWWFYQDTFYLLPKSFVFIKFSNILTIRDPVSSVMNLMIVDLFLDSVNEFIYPASLANLEFGIDTANHGIKLYFSGFNEKMPVFVNNIIEKLVTFAPDSTKFDAIKENKFRMIRNFNAERPLYQADKLLSCLMAEVLWTQEDLLSTIDDITMENFKQHFKIFFSQFFTEGFMYGNFKSNEAFSLLHDIETTIGKYFHVKPLLKSQLTTMREILLPENSNYIFQYNNSKQPVSALLTYLQGLEQSTKNDVIVKLSDQILSEPIFNTLRTQEQLGYIVGCNIKMSNSTQGHRIYLQSSKKPSELDARVNEFLVNFRSVLESMPEEEYFKYVSALKNKILERPKDMMKQANKYWMEILNEHYNFERDTIQAEELMSVTKDDLISYFSKFIDPSSKFLKKLSVYILSEQTHGSNLDVADESKVSVVTDIVQFKKSLPLSPLMRPILPPVKEMPTAKL